MADLKEKVVLVTGASRGIGKQTALTLAREGASVVILGKSVSPNSKPPGTIYETAQEIIAHGGKALPICVDIRFEKQIVETVDKVIAKFGRIDAIINNAGSIYLSNTLTTTPKHFDLMNQINARGPFLMIQTCYPHLKKSSNPHIINISPPLNMNPQWFKDYLAYTLSKYTQSLFVLGMSPEFAKDGVAINALWPKTLINTNALSGLFKNPTLVKEIQRHTRHPSVMADAVCHIIKKPSRQFTGQFLIDEEVLKSSGTSNILSYSTTPGVVLQPDYYL